MGRYQQLLHAVPDPRMNAVLAKVIGRANRPFLQTMILDAGRDNRALPGEAVMDPRGMIGRIRLILTDDTLTEITASTRTEARWRDMLRVEETGQTTYIYVTGMSVAMVPKHGFADEEDYYSVRDFARSHVGKVSSEN